MRLPAIIIVSIDFRDCGGCVDSMHGYRTIDKLMGCRETARQSWTAGHVIGLWKEERVRQQSAMKNREAEAEINRVA